MSEAFVRRTQPTQSDPFNEGLLSTRQMSLLMGVSEEEFRAEFDRQQAANPGTESLQIPKQWIRQGKEICARLGVDSVESALQILEAEAQQ